MQSKGWVTLEEGAKQVSKFDSNTFEKNILISHYLLQRVKDSFPRKLNLKIMRFKNLTSFVRPKRPKARANKTGFDFMIFILMFLENCL